MPSAAILVFDNCNASSVTTFADVLCAADQMWRARQPKATPLFTWQLVSVDGKPVTTSTGMTLQVDAALAETRADIMYVPACHFTSQEGLLREVDALAARSKRWLISHRKRGGWLAGGCSGAFVLASAGLLDGRVATTSWWLAALFKQRFPGVQLRDDELVTESDRILCGGPVNAHYNLALRVVETFGGKGLMLACAKVLLVDVHRPSQLPYIMLQDQLGHSDELVLHAQQWIQRNLHRRDFSIEAVAKAIGASPRNLIRRFKAVHGVTPVGYVQARRIELAKNLLETTSLEVAAIVDRIGYQDGAAFRRLFKEGTSLSPREYRARFAVGKRRGRGK